MTYELTIPGEPQGKARPRVYLRGGKPRAYTPENTASYERYVALLWDNQYPNINPIDKAVAISISSYHKIADSYSAKKKKELLGQPCTKKPDADNIAKIILDSLNGRAFIDDKNVVALSITKTYDENPRVQIVVQEYEDG